MCGGYSYNAVSIYLLTKQSKTVSYLLGRIISTDSHVDGQGRITSHVGNEVSFYAGVNSKKYLLCSLLCYIAVVSVKDRFIGELNSSTDFVNLNLVRCLGKTGDRNILSLCYRECVTYISVVCYRKAFYPYFLNITFKSSISILHNPLRIIPPVSGVSWIGYILMYLNMSFTIYALRLTLVLPKALTL